MEWKEKLSSEELKNEQLIDVLEYFDIIKGDASRVDIEGIKETLDMCYPYQIKNAILTVNRGKYSDKFTSFGYVKGMLKKGVFGTKAKNKFKNKKNNQTDVGVKICKGREEMIDVLDAASANMKDDEAFDFNILR